MTEHAPALSDEVSEAFIEEFLPAFLAAWNSHDPERLVALANADVVWEDPYIAGGRLTGHAALREWLRSVWRAMPDLTFDIVGDVHVARDRRSLMIGWHGVATMTGPLHPPGFAPTDQPVEMSGVDTHYFANGKLTRVVTVTDVMATGRQIGAAPAAGSGAEWLSVQLQRLTARRLRKHSLHR